MENSILKTRFKTPIETFVIQIRKNHALEHASIHVLETKYHKKMLSGYSIYNGFFLIGQLTIQEAQDAADLALARLQHGEKHLAIHPGCGTNLAVTGFCTALGAMITMAGANSRKERWNRFSTLVSMSSAMVMISKPLGIKAQKYITTDADLSGLRIIGINASELFGQPCFFVETSLTSQGTK